MKLRKIATMSGVTLAFIIFIGSDSNIFAQGRGGGRPMPNPSVNRPTNNGNGNVDKGLTTSSDRSNGRSDVGLGNASRNSDGRSDDGLNRARTVGGNRELPSDNELNRYRGIARKLNTTSTNLRSRYAAALATNPDLKWGQFVAANVIADNLNARNSNITATAILSGLQRGDSIGKTLQNLGINSNEAKQVEKNAKRQIKESMKNQ